jgi:starch phosphorylase
MYKFLGTYNVIPSMPESLEHLRKVAYNLMWTWNPEARELFRRLDRDLWEVTNHNSVMVLGKVSQERLVEVSHDDGFKSHLDRVYKSLQDYLQAKTWYSKNYSHSKNFNIIYFSAEFGLTECLQTYSGGLGVLAGDHLKASSDLGIPLIGVGLLYREGYFQQYLNSDGWQLERYELNDFNNLPTKLMMDKKNQPFTLSVQYDSKEVFFQVWKIDVGRVPLYLLDTNVPQNSEADKKITRALYGGNIETRIEQEIILGIGGIKMLRALNIQPAICHMNEGHSAFMALERMRFLIQEEGLTYKEAREIGFYSNVFTTHTPVPAGIDVFSNELMEKYLGKYYREELKISDKEFYSLGTIYRDKESSVFNMAHLAMNTAGYVNGVSKLHGSVSKKMWVSGYKDVPFNEIPIDYITNGVHLRSHISREIENLFVQYIGEDWVNNPVSEQLWKRIDNIPDEELWRTHERRRERLVAFARRRLARQAKARGEGHAEITVASEVLDPTALTIGFARRFATYKRATLIFKDVERLADILNNKSQPVQFIIAGKAHPKDEEGKRLIQEICQIAKEDRFRRRIVFIENYDINVARYMVEGCDIWLNTPRRLLEASGTSGMKVIANGGLNFSILDGWWDEGFDPEVGWKIGKGEEYTDHDYQDEVEARQLYHILESQIVPLFYTRAEDLLPRGWITKVKNSMKKLGPFFNTHRMVQEYFKKFYEPAYEKRKELQKEKWAKAIELADWKEKIRDKWSHIKVEKVLNGKKSNSIFVGEEFPVNSEINLGELTPDDVEVQLYFGPVENQDDPELNSTVVMSPANSNNGVINYKGNIVTKHSGQQGFTIRIVPKNPMLISPFEVGLVYWAG